MLARTSFAVTGCVLLLLSQGCDSGGASSDESSVVKRGEIDGQVGTVQIGVAVSGTPTVALRDSAGIQIVENEGPAPEAAWLVDEVPIVFVGGGSDGALYRVVAAERLASGAIVIANQGRRELRAYSPSGDLLWSAGQEGDGPGEFRLLSTVFSLEGDSVAAFDLLLRRISIFDSGGGFARTIRVEGPPNGPAPLTRVAGSVYLMSSAPGFPIAVEGPPRVERHRMYMHSFVEGEPAELVAEVPGLEVHVAGTRPGGAAEYVQGSRLFGTNTTIVADGDGWVVADSDHAELRFWESDGGLGTIVRWQGTRRAVTPVDIESDRQWDLARRSSPDEANLRDLWSRQPEPPGVMPAFDSVLLSDDRSIWVGEYRPRAEGEVNRYMVFDRDGVRLGTATVPEGLRLLAVGGDWVLGVKIDALGVESVALHRVERQ